jgi:hypothetical protein
VDGVLVVHEGTCNSWVLVVRECWWCVGVALLLRVWWCVWILVLRVGSCDKLGYLRAHFLELAHHAACSVAYARFLHKT